MDHIRGRSRHEHGAGTVHSGGDFSAAMGYSTRFLPFTLFILNSVQNAGGDGRREEKREGPVSTPAYQVPPSIIIRDDAG